jgi:hypothetical protein
LSHLVFGGAGSGKIGSGEHGVSEDKPQLSSKKKDFNY